MKEFLLTLLNSLNKVEIKGKDNMDILLACILAVEREIAKIDAEEDTGEDNGE